MKSKIHKHYTSSNSIQRRRVREQKKWTQLFNECEQFQNCTYVSTLHPEIKLRTLQHRYNLYKQNKNKQTKQTTIYDEATIDHRSINKQTFTPEQETTLANHIRNLIQSRSQLINKSVIKNQALLFYKQLHPHTTRNITFKVSDGWIQRFKARHHFPTNKTKIIKTLNEKKKI